MSLGWHALKIKKTRFPSVCGPAMFSSDVKNDDGEQVPYRNPGICGSSSPCRLSQETASGGCPLPIQDKVVPTLFEKYVTGSGNWSREGPSSSTRAPMTPPVEIKTKTCLPSTSFYIPPSYHRPNPHPASTQYAEFTIPPLMAGLTKTQVSIKGERLMEVGRWSVLRLRRLGDKKKNRAPNNAERRALSFRRGRSALYAFGF